MSGSPPEAITRVPQYSPLQPVGRSHPATKIRPVSPARLASARASRVVGMAPKISRDAERRQVRKQGCGSWGRSVEVGGGDRVAPRRDDGVGDLLKRHGPAEYSSERGYPTCDLWLAAYGCNDLLRAVEQNGPMLQECVSFPDLRRAHQLATGDEYLAAHRGREAGRRLVDPRGWWRLVGGHRGIGTEGPERSSDAFVDGVVRVT